MSFKKFLKSIFSLKNIIRFYLLVVIIVTVLLFFNFKINFFNQDYTNAPHSSFVEVKSMVIITNHTLNDTTDTLESFGSGIVVKTTLDKSYILSASHVCDSPEVSIDNFWKQFFDLSIEEGIEIQDYYGEYREAKFIFNDPIADLCLLEVEGVWASPVPISMNPARVGEKVINLAAPTTFWAPGMVPIFEGIYSGNIYDMDLIPASIYTFPVRKGSSGSGVLNKNMELVGIVHSTLETLDEVGLTSTHAQLYNFLLQYEILF